MASVYSSQELLEQKKILFKNKTESMVRDINLSLILGDTKLVPNIKDLQKGKNLFFNKKYWKIIEKYKKNCIITGSCSLIIYGLIEREPRDIDLIPFDIKEIGILQQDRYADDKDDTNMYGFKKINGYYVDFLPYTKDISYEEINGYKVQNPFQVILKKSELYTNSFSKMHLRKKDASDIVSIQSMFNGKN